MKNYKKMLLFILTIAMLFTTISLFSQSSVLAENNIIFENSESKIYLVETRTNYQKLKVLNLNTEKYEIIEYNSFDNNINIKVTNESNNSF